MRYDPRFDDEPLSPARGVVIGIILGLGLWAVAILITAWWVR